jgi:dihydroxyacid dehydratase/phosphogluconate dehydratase
MRSDLMKKGLEKAPHRSLFKALGLTDEEIRRPLIGIANSANEIIPGPSRPASAWRGGPRSSSARSASATASP